MLNPFFPGASGGGGGGEAPFQFSGLGGSGVFRQGDPIQIDLKNYITPARGVSFPTDLVFTIVGSPQGFPPGFDISPDGVIDTIAEYGPDETYFGSFQFEISIVSDLLGHEEIGNISITIERPVITPLISSTDGFVLTFGESASIDLNDFYAVSGSNETLAFSYNGSLPQGITFDDQTGIISGTPTVSGTVDVAQITAQLPLSLIESVLPIPFSVPGPFLQSDNPDPVFYQQNVSVSRTLNGMITVGGLPSTGLNITYTLDPDSVLPPGLSLGAQQLTPGDPIQFIIQGTPTGLHPDGQFATVVIRATYQGQTIKVPLFFCDVSLDRDAVITGGAVLDYSWGGFDFRRHRFTTSDTAIIQSGGWLNYAVVGGGGPGGAAVANNGGGGGGAGYPRQGRIWVPAGTMTVIVGAGGAPGSDFGGDSSISMAGMSTVTGHGGQAGAAAVSATTGRSTASYGLASTGGGAAGTSTGGTAGIAGGTSGSSGSAGFVTASGGNAGGGGGFSGSPFSANATNSADGGAGIKMTFGASVIHTLSYGGGGGARNGGIQGRSGAGAGGPNIGGGTNTAGGAGPANSGAGGGGGGGGSTPGAGGAGGSGVVMLWTRRP